MVLIHAHRLTRCNEWGNVVRAPNTHCRGILLVSAVIDCR
jgi:hypothetical protein